MRDVDLLIKNGVNVEKSMEIFGDMTTYDETLQVFLDEVTGKLEKVKMYKEAGNMADYAVLVHSLKSDAKYFGFETLAELAYQHELESKADHVYYVYEHYDELLKETNRIITLVHNYLNKGNNPDEALKEEVSSGSEDTGKKKILIVDDSDIIRSVTEKIFSSDYAVLSANDGREAIDSIINNKDDNLVAVLLDLNMPNVDGFEVLEFFKNNDLFKTISVSIITGNDDAMTDKQAFEYPIVDILKKPFNEANIKSIVERTINKLQ